MNKFKKFLYEAGVLRFTFKDLESFAKEKQIEHLVFACQVENHLIQEKAIKTLGSFTDNPRICLFLLEFVHLCDWKLNKVVIQTLLKLIEQPHFKDLKEKHKDLLSRLEMQLSTKASTEHYKSRLDLEYPSERLKKGRKIIKLPGSGLGMQ